MGAEMDAVRISNERKCIVCIQVHVAKLFIMIGLRSVSSEKFALCCILLRWNEAGSWMGGGGGGGGIKCR